MKCYILHSTGFDPHENLAMEESLLPVAAADSVILYLWQNANTVVIGRHQNPWQECRVSLLESEGGKLVRRPSGGGAVFHDLGNLNFTFAAANPHYDVQRHLSVVLDAVRSFGIDASFSGRNDLVDQEGRKFSGNAFLKRDEASVHHGTLLLNADMAKFPRYLNVSQDKLAAKGIQSVRSRITNLCEDAPDITVESMKSALERAFIREYGEAELLPEADIRNSSAYAQALERQRSWEWRFGHTPQFDITFKQRFSWGAVEVCLDLRQGRVAEAQVYSDAMDEALISTLPSLLKERPFNPAELALAFQDVPGMEGEDLRGWMLELEI